MHRNIRQASPTNQWGHKQQNKNLSWRRTEHIVRNAESPTGSPHNHTRKRECAYGDTVNRHRIVLSPCQAPNP